MGPWVLDRKEGLWCGLWTRVFNFPSLKLVLALHSALLGYFCWFVFLLKVLLKLIGNLFANLGL